ncbi:hypothetical protein Zmor_016488 [Zophobas morio]|uniref:E3 ubiquitin-protein ligase FANCL n=2 Tax=Zophobas morio TaxID=2755281 RepID=A0AA38I6X0_9CUCU|nr:hypothetical protein Zmor_016488 [Zophobas morio]
MEESELELLLKYPLLACHTQDGAKHYVGKILFGNHDIDLHVVEENVRENPTFKLKTIYGGSIDDALSKITAPKITEFVDKIVTTLENEPDRKPPQNLTKAYRRILQEYSEFTGFHLTIKKCQISSDLSKIHVTTVDEGCREHGLDIAVDWNETAIFIPLGLNLPEQVTNSFPTNFPYLTEIYSKFIAAIEDLQPFFDVMDDLDRSCCVLDPEVPTRRDCYRRIWLDQNLSVMVIVNLANVKSRPELKFLGPERVVQPWFEKLGDKLEDWDEKKNFVQELLNILGLETFPVKPRQDRVTLMDAGECSICFSLRLNDKLPEIICENKCCENHYHVECLYEWLTSINSKRMFNQLHGQCPNCEKKIACPIPDLV